MDLFERVVSERGRLLRVERYADHIKVDSSLVSALLLTFDVGRILVWGSAKTAKLVLEHIQNPENIPRQLVKLDEKEPWWRIMGSPLAAVRSFDENPGYQLQFRENDRNPRIVSLALEGDRIRIGTKKASIKPRNNRKTPNKTQ